MRTWVDWPRVLAKSAVTFAVVVPISMIDAPAWALLVLGSISAALAQGAVDGTWKARHSA